MISRTNLSCMPISTNLLCLRNPAIILFLSFACSGAFAATCPGIARGKLVDHGATLGNDWIAIRADDRLHQLAINLPALSRTLSLGDAFTLRLKDGTSLSSSAMSSVTSFNIQPLRPLPSAAQLAERSPGKEVCTDLQMPQNYGQVHWCAVLRDGSGYIRQELTIQAASKPVPISEVDLLQFSDAAAHVDGAVKGSPIIDDTMYFGFEHPLSISEVKGDRVVAILPRQLPLQPGQSITYSSVIGVAPEGQMRRSFLEYIERERAHPYRTFLHYNTWYDLGFRNRFDEAGALNRIHAFGEELTKRRNVVLDSFLFDDGWDDANTVWNFDSGFPDGFARVQKAAAAYHFGIGVWLSPWGGYEETQQRRLAAGRKLGYEIVKDGFALSGPHYYSYFEQTCLDMIRKYGVNQFKFDGTGNANQVFPGSVFDSDFDAAIHLTKRLREQSPNLYINLTSGTYPSPFWLRYADSIWRGGMDHSFSGVGTWRQRWITYRDAQTYKHVVEAGPLYPLNSLMVHGLIYATQADHLETDPGNDFSDEVHSYFGSGTQLQEMYITPSLLSKHNWDILAEAARWSRANASILRDTHWIGGDPDRLQVYGWAAWTENNGNFTLRNPSDKSQDFSLDIGAAFELPVGANLDYLASSPWKSAPHAALLRLEAGHPHTFTLEPFEVLTLEAHPRGR
jgi:hypothetical protein